MTHSDVHPSAITEAATANERQQVQRLFEETIGDIAPGAVPAPANSYFPALVAQYRPPDTSVLAGAALAVRSQLAGRAAELAAAGAPLPPPLRRLLAPGVLDRHRELDLIGVRRDFRDRGIGSQLLAYVEGRLRADGVRVLFGNVTDGLDAEALRRFYGRHGYRVLDDGQDLPPLLGAELMPPMAALPVPPRFFFFKMLTG
ncbi:GNAT family N-acetyltransferase [Micromonospora sp. NPDC049048]|uniref:GNAT family N-acetyltransferase n=1 Tax=Micromonospora sp. NPDC049048 TaxID=3364263 RepID=UPI0037119EBE